MSIRVIDCKDADYGPKVQAVLEVLRGGRLTSADADGELDIPRIVQDILAKVAAGGDKAAAELTSKLDQADITPATLRVPAEVIAEAHAAAEPEFLQLVRRVAANIRQYQQSILVRPPSPLKRAGRGGRPGDSIVFLPGTYSGTLRPEKSGEPDRPIVYRAAERRSVKLTGVSGNRYAVVLSKSGENRSGSRIIRKTSAWQYDPSPRNEYNT